jgi:hypothetical protein
MSVEQTIQRLSGVQHPDIQGFAAQADMINKQVLAHSLTRNEADELLGDLQRSAVIAEAAGDLQVKEAIHQVVNGLVALSGALL